MLDPAQGYEPHPGDWRQSLSLPVYPNLMGAFTRLSLGAGFPQSLMKLEPSTQPFSESIPVKLIFCHQV